MVEDVPQQLLEAYLFDVLFGLLVVQVVLEIRLDKSLFTFMFRASSSDRMTEGSMTSIQVQI